MLFDIIKKEISTHDTEGDIMDKLITVLQIIVPIFIAIFLGALARRKKIVSAEEVKGLQQYAMKFGLPCVLFNSCLTSNLGTESLTSMALLLPLVLASSLWAFGARKKLFKYHNLPLLFSAQESGMLGIPLFMTLFGAEQAYRMGVFDMTQSLIAIPVIAILMADDGDNPSVSSIAKKVVQSPLLIMSILGLILNLSGAADILNQIGAGGIITETTGFLAQPVSAVILFSVGYNFSLNNGNLKQILKISGIHFAMFAVFGLIIQGVMFLLPSVDMETRWAILIYSTLPASFLSPGLGRKEEEHAVASGVCSMLTVVSLLIFCVVAFFAS